MAQRDFDFLGKLNSWSACIPGSPVMCFGRVVTIYQTTTLSVVVCTFGKLKMTSTSMHAVTSDLYSMCMMISMTVVDI